MSELESGDEVRLIRLCDCRACEASKKENLGKIFIFKEFYFLDGIKIEGWNSFYSRGLFEIVPVGNTNLGDWL